MNSLPPPPFARNLVRVTQVFRNQWPPLIHDFDANDWVMSDAMSSFWTNMAATGDPNKGPMSVPLTWPLFVSGTGTGNYSNVNMQVSQCFRAKAINNRSGFTLPFYICHLLQFALPLGTTTNLNQARCDMWDSVLAQLQASGGVIN